MTDPCTCPEPPYYSVIFTNQRTDGDDGYGKMAERMVELAEQQPGFLGVDTARDADGFGITVSYWSDLDSIKNWRNNAEHLQAQKLGREKWYQSFSLRIAKVERASNGP
jgi:heme-degrading monooxygenase HmoA